MMSYMFLQRLVGIELKICSLVLYNKCFKSVLLDVFWSGQNHLARLNERGKKTRQTEEEVGRQHQGMDRVGVRQVPKGNGEKGKMKKTGYKIIRGAPTTLAVKGLMMMMILDVYLPIL